MRTGSRFSQTVAEWSSLREPDASPRDVRVLPQQRVGHREVAALSANGPRSRKHDAAPCLTTVQVRPAPRGDNNDPKDQTRAQIGDSALTYPRLAHDPGFRRGPHQDPTSSLNETREAHPGEEAVGSFTASDRKGSSAGAR